MRRSIAALLFACAPAAALAQDSSSVRISFDLSRCAKASFCSPDHLSGEGLVVGSGEDGTVAYAEVHTKHGPNATVEFLKSGDAWVVHYWESSSSGLSFFGTITESAVHPAAASGAWTLGGQFSFRAEDGEQIRIVENGVVESIEREPNPPPVDPACSYNCGGGAVIIVDNSGGCGGSEPAPPDDGTSDTGCEGDTGTDDPYSDGSSGCEGDTDDSSSSSAGGCEGDSGSSSSSSSDGCEGDSYQASANDVKSRRATNSMFRLAWPIVLAGGLNRAIRARAAKKTPPPPSR